MHVMQHVVDLGACLWVVCEAPRDEVADVGRVGIVVGELVCAVRDGECDRSALLDGRWRLERRV